MSRGGPRPGAGRPKGSKDEKAMLKDAEAQGMIEPGSSLDYLRRVFQGKVKVTAAVRVRVEAARAVAPYEYARLSDTTPKPDPRSEEEMATEVQGLIKAGLLTQVANNPETRALLVAWAKSELGLIEKPEQTIPAADNVVPLMRH